MELFAYGSLMCEESLKRTTPKARIHGPVVLTGYQRVFNLRSPYRRNPETGVYSSALNIRESKEHELNGVLIHVPDDEPGGLFIREKGYETREVEVLDLRTGDRRVVTTFVATEHEPHPYVFNDPFQEEYLNICIRAAQRFGNEFAELFLTSTFINGSPVKELKLVSS